MPEYLILKLEGDEPTSFHPTARVFHEGEPAEALPQGFAGDGRYAIVNWGERVEADLSPGPVTIAGLEDADARAQTEEEA